MECVQAASYSPSRNEACFPVHNKCYYVYKFLLVLVSWLFTFYVYCSSYLKMIFLDLLSVMLVNVEQRTEIQVS